MPALPQNELPLLVTGAAGFIGSRFVQACNVRGIPVVSVDELEQFSDRTEHAGIDFGEQVDLKNLFDWLAAETRAFRGIVHLGACSDTTETNATFLDSVNLGYSKNIWNYATAHATPLVYASSAATYGGGEQGYEDDEGNFDTQAVNADFTKVVVNNSHFTDDDATVLTLRWDGTYWSQDPNDLRIGHGDPSAPTKAQCRRGDMDTSGRLYLGLWKLGPTFSGTIEEYITQPDGSFCMVKEGEYGVIGERCIKWVDPPTPPGDDPVNVPTPPGGGSSGGGGGSPHILSCSDLLAQLNAAVAAGANAAYISYLEGAYWSMVSEGQCS
jgi:hypothetical protein